MARSSMDWRAASRDARERLARHSTGYRYPGHDKLHLQLGLLRAKLAHLVGAFPA
jgi:hypothetical protein